MITPYGLVGAPWKSLTSDQQSPQGFQLHAIQLTLFLLAQLSSVESKTVLTM